MTQSGEIICLGLPSRITENIELSKANAGEVKVDSKVYRELGRYLDKKRKVGHIDYSSLVLHPEARKRILMQSKAVSSVVTKEESLAWRISDISQAQDASLQDRLKIAEMSEGIPTLVIEANGRHFSAKAVVSSDGFITNISDSTPGAGNCLYNSVALGSIYLKKKQVMTNQEFITSSSKTIKLLERKIQAETCEGKKNDLTKFREFLVEEHREVAKVVQKLDDLKELSRDSDSSEIEVDLSNELENERLQIEREIEEFQKVSKDDAQDYYGNSIAAYKKELELTRQVGERYRVSRGLSESSVMVKPGDFRAMPYSFSRVDLFGKEKAFLSEVVSAESTTVATLSEAMSIENIQELNFIQRILRFLFNKLPKKSRELHDSFSLVTSQALFGGKQEHSDGESVVQASAPSSQLGA